MSGYILCQTQKAKIPYYIENISTNVYSLEELCYYFYHNLYLVDESILNEQLCRWLQEELNLPKLAAKLRSLFTRNFSLEEFLYPVFKEINYLTYEEMKSLNLQIQKLAEESPLLRAKCKGDALVQNDMYVQAIQVYQKLLDEENIEEVREGFTESVYHNLGCAYSYLFQMEKPSSASTGHMRAAEAGRHWRLISWQSALPEPRRVSERGKKTRCRKRGSSGYQGEAGKI